MKKVVLFFTIILGVAVLVSAVKCNNGGGKTENSDNTTPVASSAPVINYSLVNVYPHDTTYFTEGLEFYKGQLFESSGGDNEASPFPSAVGILDLKTGKVATKIQLDRDKYFGEGITFFNDKLYLLTWKSGVGFIYDPVTFKKIREFRLPSKEGWGMTHDISNLIMSDGTSNLYFLSPDSLRLMKIVGVSDNNGPIPNINELEFIDGYIYANQWLTAYIYKIDPSSGKVLGRMDLSGLAKEAKANNEDPNWNGIAYDSTTKSILVSGKKWRSIYAIRLL
jgi:glutaminyl-peptide cyclotransferase